MKFETKCKKLGIEKEVQSIIENCECGEITDARIIELSKLRNWEIQETVCDYVEWHDKDGNKFDVDNYFRCNLKTLMNTLGVSKMELAELYAAGICEDGGEIAYAINEDIILALD